MTSIKEAFNKKVEFEAMGYMLPEKKTAYPFWVDEEEKKDWLTSTTTKTTRPIQINL